MTRTWRVPKHRIFCIRCWLRLSEVPHKYRHSPSIMIRENVKRGFEQGLMSANETRRYLDGQRGLD